MSNRVKRITAVSVILLLPVIALFVMRSGKNVYIELPYFSASSNKEKAGTDKYQIPAFSLKQIDNQIFVSDSLKDKISVIYRYSIPLGDKFTVSKVRIDRCYEIFSQSSIVRFVGIVDDPNKITQIEADSLVKSVQGKERFFLVKADSSQTVLNNYLFNDFKQDTISVQAVLVDTKNHIRGQYNIARKSDSERLMDELKLLIVKEHNGNTAGK